MIFWFQWFHPSIFVEISTVLLKPKVKPKVKLKPKDGFTGCTLSCIRNRVFAFLRSFSNQVSAS